MNLSTPIENIPKISSSYREKLKKLGIKTVHDLLYHFPHRYEDFSKIVPIGEVKINQKCCVKGEILRIKNTTTWKKKMVLTEAILQDNTGAIKVVWFNQPYLLKTLKKGDIVCVAGKTAVGEEGVYFSNPIYEKLSSFSGSSSHQLHTGRLVSVYPETEGLSSRWLRRIIKFVLSKITQTLTDPLPQNIIKKYHLLPFQKALFQIHFPDSQYLAKKAQERFSFEELFVTQLWVLREKIKLAREKAVSLPLKLQVIQKFVKSLPFKLTDAQKKCAWRILKDLQKPHPMNRLLQGDVGSGKTVVAAIAALNTAIQKYQVAFMAPTEILAKQHFKTFWELLKDFNLKIGLLTSKTDKFFSPKLKNETIEISRQKLLEETKKGEIDILIGTHSLIQDKVKFKKLGLVILDEQHRFGVEQRAKLSQQKGFIPHLLSMTATPIPRTLALTLYGDLDISLLDELPKGRKKVITKIIPPHQREKAYEFARKEVEKGHQVFVICPRIEKPEKEKESVLEMKAVKEEYERLSKEVFPDLRVRMLHGKMSSKEKEKIMEDFKNKKFDILVSTSVVEVGVDIPDATLIIIEGAERFGLAQLHQFRGRVGRSHHQSFCFLFTNSSSKKTKERLKALIESENGFELAEKDLKIRGPGDFSGKRQWGVPDIVMKSLSNLALVEKAREAAKEILLEDLELKKYPLLKQKIEKLGERLHLE